MRGALARGARSATGKWPRMELTLHYANAVVSAAGFHCPFHVPLDSGAGIECCVLTSGRPPLMSEQQRSRHPGSPQLLLGMGICSVAADAVNTQIRPHLWAGCRLRLPNKMCLILIVELRHMHIGRGRRVGKRAATGRKCSTRWRSFRSVLRRRSSVGVAASIRAWDLSRPDPAVEAPAAAASPRWA